MGTLFTDTLTILFFSHIKSKKVIIRTKCEVNRRSFYCFLSLHKGQLSVGLLFYYFLRSTLFL